jgi:hypothetical protein
MRTERWGLMALLVVTLVWGTTFPAMKLLSAQLDALQIIWGRFAIALLVLAPLWWGMRRSERRWGLLLGALLFLAFWLQIEGLARTSSNRNAFVTGLNVLVVPIIAMAALGRRYGWRLWAACALACAGMALMFHENEPWNLGDSLTLASTVFYAIYILTLEESARRTPLQPLRATRMAAAQASVMLAASTALLLLRGGELPLARLPSLDAEALDSTVVPGPAGECGGGDVAGLGSAARGCHAQCHRLWIGTSVCRTHGLGAAGRTPGLGRLGRCRHDRHRPGVQPVPTGPQGRHQGAVSGTSATGRGLPSGADARPLRTAAMSSSLGYSPSNQ